MWTESGQASRPDGLYAFNILWTMVFRYVWVSDHELLIHCLVDFLHLHITICVVVSPSCRRLLRRLAIVSLRSRCITCAGATIARHPIDSSAWVNMIENGLMISHSLDNRKYSLGHIDDKHDNFYRSNNEKKSTIPWIVLPLHSQVQAPHHLVHSVYNVCITYILSPGIRTCLDFS